MASRLRGPTRIEPLTSNGSRATGPASKDLSFKLARQDLTRWLPASGEGSRVAPQRSH